MSDGSVEYRQPSYGPDDGFLIPVQWAFDDYKKRAPVLDAENENRVVRMVGWRRCILCKRPFFSGDVKRNQICPGYHREQD